MSEVYPTDTSSEPILNHVYALVDPRDSQVRYVGVTVTAVEARSRRHILEAHHKDTDGNWKRVSVHNLWLRELGALGLSPTVLVLEITTDRKRECYWITHHRELGCNLNNQSKGGEGSATIPEEAKIKISRANRGKIVSDTTRNRLRDANTGHRSGMAGKKHSPEAIEKIRELNPAGECHPNYGRVHTMEARLKMGASRVGRQHSEETKRKIAASHLGICPNEETKQKQRAAKLGKKLVVEPDGGRRIR